MKIAKVIGSVTLARAHPTMRGASFKLAVPLTESDLRALDDRDLNREPPDSAITAEELVVYDVLGAAEGQVIGITEGREAVNPFFPEYKPVDAYNALIVDKIQF